MKSRGQDAGISYANASRTIAACSRLEEHGRAILKPRRAETDCTRDFASPDGKPKSRVTA